MKLLSVPPGTTTDLATAIAFINALMLDDQKREQQLERGPVSVVRAAQKSYRAGVTIMVRYTGKDVALTAELATALERARYRKRLNTIDLGILTFTPEPLD